MTMAKPLALAALVLGATFSRTAAQQTPQRPNIVYIIADDQGWKDVGYHGSDIQTPTIDRLAATGMRFEQFYAQAFCTATRAALMTGRYPFRYGLQTSAIPSAARYGLDTTEYLLPQALHAAGYYTAIVGKWHLGHADRKYWPLQRGFDYQYGMMTGENDHFTQSTRGVRDWYRNGEPLLEDGYVTELVGNDAVRLIKKHDPQTPLFLYLAFTAPHSPYQVPPSYLKRYPKIADSTRQTYCAMISAMDDQIDRVIKALEQRGMRENTIIIYQSDNGGLTNAMFAGETDVSKLDLPADNGPWRGGKGDAYEGGNRVPMVVNWPGHIPAGVMDQMAHVVDMLPTLADAAGANTSLCKPLDGLSMWPTLTTGAPSPRAEVVYTIEPFRAALRQGDWKLVWRTWLPERVELFNIAQDPKEETNLAAGHPKQVAELQARAVALSQEAAKPMFLLFIAGAGQRALTGAVATPADVQTLLEQP